MAVAISTSACETEVCSTWVETAVGLETELGTCGTALVETTSQLLEIETEIVAMQLQSTECDAQLGELTIELDGMQGELDAMAGELDLLSGDLEECWDNIDQNDSCPVGSSPVAAANEVFLNGIDPLPWSLPSQPFTVQVPDSQLFDSRYGNPGCCEVYDLTITCGGDAAFASQ